MVIEMKDGRLTVGGQTLFTGLSFRVKGGDVLYIDHLPPLANTTLMHVLMGLLPLDEGVVSIDGEPMNELSAAWLRRHIGYVPNRLRWPDDERFKGLSDRDVHQLLMENAAAGDSPIVLIDGIYGASDEDLCRRMAQSGRAVVACREQLESNTSNDDE